MPDPARAFTVVGADGVALSGEESGGASGADAVVLLHGLTASRRYVVMGSTVLQRAGHRVISYDARGHGRSTPAAHAEEYGYGRLADDLEAVLDERGVQRAVLAGASMGAHTALRFALSHPARVAALAIITPSFDTTPNPFARAAELERWDALARGLREGGVDGFVAAYDLDAAPAALRATLETVLRQRLAAHEHPLAVADALEAVPRSRPFDDIAQLHTIDVPTIVVASRDEADPGHPLAVGERYAQAIPQAQLLVEDEGPPTHSPLAWQGGQLSRAIDALIARLRV
jgi:3-oxoadipate enol-lactonase